MKSLSKLYLLLITVLIFSNFILISCDDKKPEEEGEVDGFTKEDRELLKKNEYPTKKYFNHLNHKGVKSYSYI